MTALVVEDRESLRGLLVTFLELDGWRVLTAEAGENALRIAERERFDLLLTDVTLPGISGLELAERLLGMKPDLMVLLTSGRDDLVEEALAGSDLEPAQVCFLPKPFTRLQLSRALAELLGR